MKLVFACLFLVSFLISDNAVVLQSQEAEDLNFAKDTLEKFSLKPNQVLLINHRTQLAIGIIEITPEGKILRLPLPKSFKQTKVFDLKPSNLELQKRSSLKPSQSLRKVSTNSELKKNMKAEELKPLINKYREWNKNQIPFFIEEEIISRDLD